jgi:hypothetical protein
MRQTTGPTTGLFATLALAAAVPARADVPGGGPEQFLDGRFKARIAAGVDGADDVRRASANAGVTLRSELGWESGSWGGVTAHVAYDDLYARAQRYETGGGMTGPQAGTRLGLPQLPRAAGVANLAWRNGGTQVVVGRQRLALAGERYVGVVGWRPGEQTYDGVRLSRQLSSNAQFSYAFVAGINVPERADRGQPALRQRGNFHLFDGTLDAGRLGRLTGFAYRLSFDERRPAPGVATAPAVDPGATWGVEWKQELKLGPRRPLPLALSYATASRDDAARGPYAARYLQLDAGLFVPGTRLKVGRGTLERDPARAGLDPRSTPLAQWYAADGWAGRFGMGGVPSLEDTWALLSTRVAGTTVEVGRHDYRGAADGRGDGEEWNTTLSRRLARWIQVQARYADRRGGPGDDRQYWFQFAAPWR